MGDGQFVGFDPFGRELVGNRQDRLAFAGDNNTFGAIDRGN